MINEIFSILTFAVVLAFVAYQKFVLPKVDADTIKDATDTVETVTELSKKFEIIFSMAKKYVVLAKKQYNDNEGAKKRNWVIKQIRDLCKVLDIVLTDNQLKAINEDAYIEMKKDENK